jgi:IclR family transcriptional regulator, acetate operon repressor
MAKANTAKAPNGRATPRYRVQSVARAFGILLAISKQEQGISRKEISREAKLSAQTTYHLLHTLSQLGLASRGEAGNYLLGVRVGNLAEGFRRQMGEAHHISKVLQSIAAKTGESVYALKWLNGEIVSFDVARGRNPIQVVELPLGISEDAHARSGGKLLLAYASEEMRKEYFSRHQLRRRTPNTICTRRELYAHFEDIRRQGYALETGEFYPGLSCIAVPIDSGVSPFAFGISAPTERIEENLKPYLKALQEGAAKLSHLDD